MTEIHDSPQDDKKLQGKGAIFGHPIHPILVDFPIAFLMAVLVSDVVFAFNGQFFWAQSSLYGLGAAILVGILAAVFGLIDFLSVPAAREHSAGWIHFIGNAVVLLVAIINVWLRLGSVDQSVVPVGLTLSIFTGLLLGITGWFGGSLVFKHHIGTVDH